MDHVERNYKIIREKMIEQMEDSLRLGRKLIDTELDVGILNFVVRPVVKSFYDYWSKHDARSGTLVQIQITLDTAKQALENGATKEFINLIMEKTFPSYLQGDQTFRQSSKRHKNYKRLKEIAKKTYLSYLNQVILLLNVNEDVKDYAELCLHAFTSKEETTKILSKQLEYTDESIRIVEEDLTILNVTIGRKIIIKALRKGFELKKKEFFDGINTVY
ncbi:MAG: hypothetical protein MUP85_19770 [Candidatus Lokiarchaeota archaeon]|nr:hypothetical protein [Candidatus Lokiarchaeota archaeon]